MVIGASFALAGIISASVIVKRTLDKEIAKSKEEKKE